MKIDNVPGMTLAPKAITDLMGNDDDRTPEKLEYRDEVKTKQTYRENSIRSNRVVQSWLIFE